MNKIFQHDVLDIPWPIESGIVNTCVTSPPYWGLRDYGVDGQLGMETAPAEYCENMVKVFREVWRVLKDNGTVWLNLGDSYQSSNSKQVPQTKDIGTQRAGCETRLKKVSGLKPKDLVGIPWRVAFALQADGWYLRQDIIWAKPNPMPESVTDRCTKSHEYIFLLSKNQKYHFNNEAIKEPFTESSIKRLKTGWNGDESRGYPGKKHNNFSKYAGSEKTKETTHRNKRSVWSVTTKSYKGAHFAVFPEDLIYPCILAGCPEGGIVLDPFMGSGTTGKVAMENQCQYIGLEINPKYIKLAEDRLAQQNLFAK